MADDYTTVRVTKATRDLINKTIRERDISADDYITALVKSSQDMAKQILISIDREKYYALQDATRILFEMKLISFPTMEESVKLAIDNLMKGMERSLQGTTITTMGTGTPPSTAFNTTFTGRQ